MKINDIFKWVVSFQYDAHNNHNIRYKNNRKVVVIPVPHGNCLLLKYIKNLSQSDHDYEYGKNVTRNGTFINCFS